MCPSYGSLKTEEKTECQCGQDVRASILRSARETDLLVNSVADIPLSVTKLIRQRSWTSNIPIEPRSTLNRSDLEATAESDDTFLLEEKVEIKEGRLKEKQDE